MANRPMTLNDLRNRENGSNAQQPTGRNLRNPDSVGGSGGLFGGMDGIQEKHPRTEHWGDMWTTTFCPNFTIWSFTALNVIIQVIIYLATVIYTSETDQGLNEKWFLGNSIECLKDFGMRIPYLIKEKGEIWRLLMSLYVNLGFS